MAPHRCLPNPDISCMNADMMPMVAGEILQAIGIAEETVISTCVFSMVKQAMLVAGILRNGLVMNSVNAEYEC